MKKPNGYHPALLASGILACLSATAGAQTIFTEDFNGYAGNQNNTQGDTGLNVAHTGSVGGWSTSGAGTMHAVDFGSSDWAILFWQNNVITQTVGIAANGSGTSYEVTFDFGTADYAGGQGTGAGDQLLVEVLRGDDSVLASDTFTPGAWGVGNYNLDGGLQGTLPYVGDGTGDVRLRIGPAPGTFNQGRFAGEVDNISVVELPPSAITITSFTATPDTLADTEDAVTFDWTVTGLPLDSLEITPGNIDVLGDTDGAGVGSYELDPGPNGTTEYTLTAIKGGDTATSMVTVTLPAPEITSFTASPSPVAPGEDVTLSWQVGLPATTLVITPGGIDVSGDTDGGGAGSIIVNPTENTSYTLTATRGTSTSDANAFAIIVQTPPDPNALVFENFDGITGLDVNGGPNGQVTTTHEVGVGGTLAGWSNAGAGTIHAVDTHNIWTGGVVSTNPANWGVMIWQDNVITQTAGTPGSNDSGVAYSIDFLAAGAVYENHAGQVNDGTTDGLRVEVLRASDDAVLHTFTQVVAQPIGVGNLGLTPYSFNYTGDGSGDIKFRVGPLNAGQGRFQATIDDLQLSASGSGPEITSITAIGGGVFELTLLGAADTGYEFRSSPILDFSPGALVENLTAGVPAVGTIGGSNDSVLTTDSNGDGTVRMTLAGPKNFVRAQIPPPLLSESFDDAAALPTGWMSNGPSNGTDWEVGTPSGGGVGAPTAADSAPNCAGTNISGYYTENADVSLTSPSIPIPIGSGATLSFRQWIDTDLTGAPNDLGSVRILDADNFDNPIAGLEILGIEGDGSAGWTNGNLVLPALDVGGKNIKVEFRFVSNAGTVQDTDVFGGFFVDDVVVTETAP